MPCIVPFCMNPKPQLCISIWGPMHNSFLHKPWTVNPNHTSVFTVRDPTQNSFLHWGQEEEAAIGLLLLAMMMMVMVLSSFVALLLVASYHNNFGFLLHHYHVDYLAPVETFSSLLSFVITNTKSGTAGTSSLWCENLAGGHAFGFNRTEACVFLYMCFDASHLWVLFTWLANYVSSTKMQLNQEVS